MLTSKPRLLDLFCGAGGATRGYQMAGFYVVGVDIKPQPRYCGEEFIQGDALNPPVKLSAFDAIHASPPCQAYSTVTPPNGNYPDLYASTKAMLIIHGVPFAIENVIGAPYSHGVMLCGSMFGLTENGEWIQRHRNFETSHLIFQTNCCHPAERRPLLVTGHAFIRECRDIKNHSRQGPFDLASRLMGIGWMNRQELTQAIPPAYTKFIGEQLMKVLATGR